MMARIVVDTQKVQMVLRLMDQVIVKSHHVGELADHVIAQAEKGTDSARGVDASGARIERGRPEIDSGHGGASADRREGKSSF